MKIGDIHACLRNRNCKHVLFTSPRMTFQIYLNIIQHNATREIWQTSRWRVREESFLRLARVLRWAWVQELTSTLWSISDGPQARSGTRGPSSQALQCRVPLAPWQIQRCQLVGTGLWWLWSPIGNLHQVSACQARVPDAHWEILCSEPLACTNRRLLEGRLHGSGALRS